MFTMKTPQQNKNPNPKEEGGKTRTRWPPYTPHEQRLLQDLPERPDFTQDLWNPIYDRRDIKAYNNLVWARRLRQEGATYPTIARRLGVHIGMVGMLLTGYNYHPLLAQLYLNLRRLGPTRPGWKWLLEGTPKPRDPYPRALQVPEQITCPHDIQDFLQQFPPLPDSHPLLQTFGLDSQWVEKHKPELFTFNLGFMTGDAGKYYPEYEGRARHYTKAAMTTNMANHASNERLLAYISLCWATLGISSYKIHSSNPEVIRWNTDYSNLITWIIRVCLGLRPGERTQWNPVRMPWLMYCPRAWVIAYLQGVADSDGHVDKRGRHVAIGGRPHLKFYYSLLEILGAGPNLYPKEDPRIVKVSLASAAQLPLFNPLVRSYRYESMIKHASRRGIPPPSSFFPSVFKNLLLVIGEGFC
jgi:hypothetical protein